LKDLQLDVPVKCYDLDNVKECISALTTNPNYYLTYMGFYQEAGKE